MTSSKLLNYPFTFTSTVSVSLKPFSDIADPDYAVIELLNIGYDMVCLSEPIITQPDKLTSKAIDKLEKIDLYLRELPDDKNIKILQSPKSTSREEPYICEITYEGGFILGRGVKSELAEKMIEIGVINKKGDLDSVLTGFIDETGDNYIEYEDTLSMAHHSMRVVSNVFNIREPVNYEGKS